MLKAPHFAGPSPRKELGQHFLQDEEIASEIINSMQLRWEERTLEIGPGRGVLLRFLLKQSHKVTAIELDQRLRLSLTRTFGGHPGLDLIFADFLKFDLVGFIQEQESDLRVVGNVPYSVTGPILFHLFAAAEQCQKLGISRFKSATLMLQREVAERLCSPPGHRIYGALSVLCALVAEARFLFSVPPEAFHPPPKVVSALIQLDFLPQARYDIADLALFKQFVHHVFAQKRKMLKNTLGSFNWIRGDWRRRDFDFTHRPEELSLPEFVRLYNLIALDPEEITQQ